MLNKNILELKSVGYWSAFGGVEVKKIEYGIEDYCICVSGCWCGKPSTHNLKIRSTNKGNYILLNGTRLYFDDCIRM